MAPERLKPMIRSNLVKRRYQVTFVKTARLVVYIHDAAADHAGDKDGQHDRSGQKILDVRHIRIDFDHRESRGWRWRETAGFAL